ncbi:MAG TPA: translation elongation factor Ts [Rhodothermales bacterium]|nr:translation elongation factor Ts [Rhodothermales bacterium]
MISASDVKRLRDMTGAGMMDCKKALTESGGDFDAAIDFLRKKGQKVSASRADREAKEGVIVASVDGDASTGVILEVNCETDFVARNDEFQRFASEVAGVALSAKPGNLDALLSLDLADGASVRSRVEELTGKIGELIGVRRFSIVKAPAGGRVVAYVHPGSRLGVMVTMSGNGDLDDVGRDVAMQVAAMNPVATRRHEVDSSVQEKEMEIAREIARNEGKPENIVDKIATGKLERFFKDHVLLEQAFVKDSSQTVEQILRAAGSNVHGFERYALNA